MHFRIAPEHKETVTIVRRSAIERDEEATVAAGVVCMMVPPPDSVNARRDSVELNSGIPIEASHWTALLEVPNPAIQKGDFVKRADGSELRIVGVLTMTGSNIMQLQLLHQGVL